MNIIINFIKSIFTKKINIAIFIAVLIIILFAGWKLHKYVKKPAIGNTKLIILEIKQIKQLFTYSFYNECVYGYNRVDDKDKDKPRYVVIAQGTVITGFDLSNLDDANSFSITGNTLTIKLDPPKIFDVIVLPSGFATFMRNGNVTDSDRVAAQKTAVEMLKSDAINHGILKLSETQGKVILKNLFESLGFDDVTVEINQPAPKEIDQPASKI